MVVVIVKFCSINLEITAICQYGYFTELEGKMR